jgi:hypothetical protein
VLRQRSSFWRRTKRSRCRISSSFSRQHADHHAELVSGGCQRFGLSIKISSLVLHFVRCGARAGACGGHRGGFTLLDVSFTVPVARSLELHGKTSFLHSILTLSSALPILFDFDAKWGTEFMRLQDEGL